MKKTTLRNKADKLVQEYIRLKYTKCLVCDRKVRVGHHFFTKASSNALRYYEPNIIPLCQECHCLIHAQPHLIQPKICFIMGEEWYQNLLDIKRQGIKANKEWYQAMYDNWQGYIKNLEEK